MEIKILQQADFRATLTALRLPFSADVNVDELQASYVTKSMNIKDIELLSNLVKAGDSHAKCIRGLWVTFAIKAPRYFWSEMDTYCVGRQPLSSTSTMHKLTSRDLTINDFEYIDEDYLFKINTVRNNDKLTAKGKLALMKKMLPESYYQTRVIQFNYQSLRNIYKQRHNHRLIQWRLFCDVVEKLDYAEEFIMI